MDEDFQNELDKYLSDLGTENKSVSPAMNSIDKSENSQKDDEPFEESESFAFSEESDKDYPLENYINIDDQENMEEENDDEASDDFNDSESESNDEENNYNTLQSILEEDDKDLLDVNDPSLYTDTNNDSVLFEELSYSDKSNIDRENYSSENANTKKSFESLNSVGKKKFEPGKLNKNNMMIAVFAFLFIVLAGFVWASREQEKKKSEKYTEDDYLSIDGYNPDFGDYRNRAYIDNTDIKNLEASEKINEILFTGEKEHYVNPNEEKKTVYAPVSSQQPVGQALANDAYKDRVESSIRKSINPKETSYLPPIMGQSISNKGLPSFGNLSSDPAGDYFEQLGKITNALQGSKGQGNRNAQSDSLRYSNAGVYNPDAQGGDISYIPENSIYPGTIISAVLVSGINTDYPGTITARVINNVYDSRTGTKLLIPAGSILRGSYSSSSIGVSRIQIAWQTLILNRDGVDFSVSLGSMVGVDAKGYSGIKGTLNEHAFSYLKAAGISCLFTLINSNIFSYSNAQKNRTTQQMISESQDIGNKLADKILDRALDIQPTVKVKNGTRISVDVDRILTLYPYDRDMPDQKYVRK